MTTKDDQIERALLTALTNLSGYRPEKAKRIWVIYETDIEQMAKDIRARLESTEPKREVIAEDYYPGCA